MSQIVRLAWCGHRAAAGALQGRVQPGERRVGWIGFGEACCREELLGGRNEVRSICGSLALSLARKRTHWTGKRVDGKGAKVAQVKSRRTLPKLAKSDASALHTRGITLLSF